MKSEIKCSGPMIMLGEGKVAVGPAIVPIDEKSGFPAMVFNRVEPKSALLVGLDGAPLPRKPGEILCIVGCPSRQAIQVLLKTCMALLDIFDHNEGQAKAASAAPAPDAIP